MGKFENTDRSVSKGDRDQGGALWTRRRAVQAIGVSALSSAFFARSVHAAEPAERKVRIGIVGGRFGASFQWHEHPQCVVAGVSDLRPERRANLQKVYGCEQAYESLEVMLRDGKDIEAVGIFTEAPNHVPHAVAALRAGKHVISAVPAAMTLDECALLVDTVRRTGLTYMMAETGYWQQHTISARRFFQEGRFGKLYAANSMYRHAGLEDLFVENGERTWRYGFPPMLYPTHCTVHMVGVTGERLKAVSCIGWGDDSSFLKDNAYANPFWNETAEFLTEKDHSFRVEVWWSGAHVGGERAEWYGDQMSFLCANGYGQPATIVRASELKELDTGGFQRAAAKVEKYDIPQWWKTEMLPEPLRHDSGHEGSHTFITHEFIDALVNERRPAVDVYEAVAYTAPGIVAHQSALRGGERLWIPDFGRPEESPCPSGSPPARHAPTVSRRRLFGRR